MTLIPRLEEKNCFIACSEDKVKNGLCDCVNRMQNQALNIPSVSISFVAKFYKYQDEYERFLMWCLDNNGKMTMDEWNTKKANEFKKRGLDTFFNEC